MFEVDFRGRGCYKGIGCVRVGALGRRGGRSAAGSDARAAVIFFATRHAEFKPLGILTTSAQWFPEGGMFERGKIWETGKCLSQAKVEGGGLEAPMESNENGSP